MCQIMQINNILLLGVFMGNNFNSKLGLRIRELRISKGIKQGELADLLNMERSNLTRIESGKQRPNDDNLIKLSEIFGVEIKDIFDFEHTIKNQSQLKKEISNNLDDLSVQELNYISNKCYHAGIRKDFKRIRRTTSRINKAESRKGYQNTNI